jgi:hypothetical protein
MTLQAALRKAWGREPTRAEVDRIERVRDAFDVGENDAFITIAAVLEFYDALYRRYPDQCANATRKAIRESLCSPRLFPKALDHSGSEHEAQRVTLACLGAAFSVLIAALGMAVGARGAPLWTVGHSGSPVAAAIASVLGAPAGWVILVVLLVPAGYAAIQGYTRARQVGSGWQERARGAALVAAVALAVIGWLALLAWGLT